MKYKAIIIGCSSGGLKALESILPLLPGDFLLPIIIVQHQQASANNFLATYLNEKSNLCVKLAEEKEFIQAGFVYIAPPDYHLLIENDYSLSLSLDEKINFARPSIDVSFETAVEVYGTTLIGMILTGASSDGTNGLKKVKMLGGHTLIQNPKTAIASAMPQSALKQVKAHSILELHEIAEHLVKLSRTA